MERGDLISVSLSGDFGKPRPALVIQSNVFDYIDSIAVLPLTSEHLDAKDCRIEILPTTQNGLRRRSYVMIDKISTLRRVKAGPIMGRVMDDEIAEVSRALAVFLGIVR